MTKSLVYSGPHPEFVIDDLNPDLVLQAGVPFDAPDDLAVRLLQQNTYSEAGAPTGPTRDELNAQAVAAGVEDPHKLPNKQAVVDAIDAANTVIPEPPDNPTAPDASAADDSTEGSS